MVWAAEGAKNRWSCEIDCVRVANTLVKAGDVTISREEAIGLSEETALAITVVTDIQLVRVLAAVPPIRALKVRETKLFPKTETEVEADLGTFERESELT